MKKRWRWAVLFLMVPGSSWTVAHAGSGVAYVVDSEKSTLQIRVYKEGLFKAFGHDHLISANKISGRVLFNEEMLEDSSVDLTVEATSLSVIDPGESDEDRRKVQNTMAGKDILDEERFPEVRFTSTRVKQVQKTHDGWEIILEGVLSLHGVEKQISLPLRVSAKDGELRAEGEASLLQTDFGITPIKVGGGSVRVKNKVRIRFDLVAEK
jgi:polyisoprenoid-binding protein YceI